MIKIIISNLLRNKRRSFLTLLGILIGVAAIISLVSVSVGLTQRSAELLTSFQGIFVLEEGAVDMPYSFVEEEYLNDLKRVPGVELVVPEIWGSANSIEGLNGDSPLSNFLFIVGIDPKIAGNYEAAPYYSVTEGRKLTSNDRNSVVVGSTLADMFDLSVGKTLKINGKTYTLIGIFETNNMLMSLLVITNIETAREVTGFKEGYYSNFQVVPNNPGDLKLVKQRIESRFEGKLQAISMQDSAELITSFISNLSVALWFISGIAGVVGGIGVMNTMLMSVMERIQEFGVLKAIGWRNKDVMTMIVMESILLSLIGGIIGVIIGFLVSTLVSYYTSIPSAIDLGLIMQAMFFALIMGVVGGLYPAYKSSMMSPIEAVKG